ncbi:MAG: nucleoside hydrolase [Ignavibacteria bacterium]|jgi:inosine-uridine nucleoside N-ribohydrolase|nr:nucleoside hydrolase [Ignavibacteria bacterium]MCU7505015.1 nucleoside hydrolase [Ignavibacteria bacterium]MCU7514851.1 nucleoside hydrolase [Ignavibacteria bacterium]
MAVKVLLDTDIGTDIDDAICLAYLLANSECELMGITTVTGEAEKRAMLASALCRIAGKDIPIFPGCETPLLIPQKQKLALQAKALKNWEHDKSFPKGEAIGFLRKTVRDNPGEIILLTIGPLTNIGILFSIDPELPSLLKGLVLMCGYFERRYRSIGPLEWNARGDYHATDIVFRSRPPFIRSVGLDVTSRVKMKPDEFRRTFTSEILRPVLDYSDYWFKKFKKVTFHDPLAAATIFDEKICIFRKGKIKIELDKKGHRGLTDWKESKRKGFHEVALKVDKERFFEHYLSMFR